MAKPIKAPKSKMKTKDKPLKFRVMFSTSKNGQPLIKECIIKADSWAEAAGFASAEAGWMLVKKGCNSVQLMYLTLLTVRKK